MLTRSSPLASLSLSPQMRVLPVVACLAALLVLAYAEEAAPAAHVAEGQQLEGGASNGFSCAVSVGGTKFDLTSLKGTDLQGRTSDK